MSRPCCERLPLISKGFRLVSAIPRDTKRDMGGKAMADSYDVVNRNGEATIKLIMTINGGAAIAMLGFAEKLLGGNPPLVTPETVGFSLKCYIVGVTLAALSHGFMNLFLMADADPSWSKIWIAKFAEPFRISAFASGILAIASFVVGSWYAASALGG
jgi:hypothetical protein